jgi:flagellar motor switch protein FliM
MLSVIHGRKQLNWKFLLSAVHDILTLVSILPQHDYHVFNHSMGDMTFVAAIAVSVTNGSILLILDVKVLHKNNSYGF